jgi:FkbM family methyltransferase
MLISVNELKRVYGVRARGILHVGAHEAEELEDYRAQGWGPVIWVEMLPEKAKHLQKRFDGDPDNIVLQAACWDKDGEEMPLFRADNGQSSSLLKPLDHLVEHPHVHFEQPATIRTARLDTILPADASFDFINFDVQGSELKAVRGLGHHIDHVKWAYLEINERPLYAGCVLLPDLDAYMRDRGFARIATRMCEDYGWGDALYLNKRRASIFELVLTRLRILFAASGLASFIRRARGWIGRKLVRRRANAL